MERLLEAELLDELPAENPEAIRSRQDLRRLNAVMGHMGIAARTLLSVFDSSAPRRIIDVGAGDGTFLLNVARRLAPSWQGVQAVLVDRQQLVRPETLEGFAELGWTASNVTADVFKWLAAADRQPLDAVMANLFLHHFSEGQLGGMLRGVADRSSVLVALEPRRAMFPLTMSRLLWLIGCNRVTRHDAIASVRAGFDGTELTQLWPTDRHWRLTEQRVGLFTHVFSAREIRLRA
jgi:hypothetical protein